MTMLQRGGLLSMAKDNIFLIIGGAEKKTQHLASTSIQRLYVTTQNRKGGFFTKSLVTFKDIPETEDNKKERINYDPFLKK